MIDPTDEVPVEAMELVGGDISMELVNTATGRDGGPLKDKLHGYDDLVTWAERVGLLGGGRARRLRERAAREHAAAEAVLERARALREVIYRVFTQDPPAPEDLEALALASAEGAAARRLEPTDDGFDFVWPDNDELEQLLWPVALSAAELLTSEERTRVKECASDSCNWLFLDQSRNRSRRWCDMRECGNRAKARRFQARHRRGRGS